MGEGVSGAMRLQAVKNEITASSVSSLAVKIMRAISGSKDPRSSVWSELRRGETEATGEAAGSERTAG